jgi:hypothetical protein
VNRTIEKEELYNAVLAVEMARVETDTGYSNTPLEDGFDLYVDSRFDWHYFPIDQILFTMRFREILHGRARKSIGSDPIKFGEFAVPLTHFKTTQNQWKYANGQDN